MKTSLAYGKGRLEIEIPEGFRSRVIAPRKMPAASDQGGAVALSLRNPIGSPALRDIVRRGESIAIVFCDITRPVPNRVILPAVLAELSAAGARADDIVLFNATGTHRANSASELEGLLGADIVSAYRIVQNDARAEGRHSLAGTTASGNDVWLDSEFLSADRKILTGFIEPHFFAGFSGGGKAILPGLARLDTVLRNHGAAHIDDARASWGLLEGNPIRAEIDEAAAMARPDFLVDVTLNEGKQIVASYAGDWRAAYAQGAEAVRRQAMTAVDAPFDIVISCNSGYPLDQNLYQSVKGMSAASRVVKQGGSIIMAAECSDGIPAHGSFGRLVSEARDMPSLLRSIRRSECAIDDQWQAQILASICEKAEVYLFSENVSREDIRRVKLKPCDSIEATLASLLEKYGRDARICVLPEGPQTIPYLA